MTNIEDIIDAARRHGEDSEPDHEVGDLVGVLRAAWTIMTPAQREELMISNPVLDLAELAA